MVARGKVEQWFERISKKSGKPFHSIKVDGKFYTYWNPVPEGFMVGATVEFNYTVKDDVESDRKFYTMQDLKIIEGGAIQTAGNIGDIMTPIGNLYAMCEEKLNGIIEQNALQMDLLIKIAEEMKIDIGFKKASEL